MLHFRGGRGISKEAYPTRRPSTTSPGLRRRASLAGRSRLHHVRMDDTNLAYLCDERMREAARSAATTNCRIATPPSSTRWWRRSRRHDARDAPVPRQLQSTHAAPAAQAGRGVAEGDGPRRLLPRIRRRALRRLPPAALPAQGQDRGAGPGDPKFGGWRQGRAQSRIEAAAKYVSLDQLALAAMRLLQHGARQQHRRGGTARWCGWSGKPLKRSGAHRGKPW